MHDNTETAIDRGPSPSKSHRRSNRVRVTADMQSMMPNERQAPRILIVGGGFAGLVAAHALQHADAEVVLIDRRNHHIFSRCSIRWRRRSSLPPRSPRRFGSSR
jgi:succinate dehydrogenase/fumarate reductase flavoprotein subunit